MPVINQEQEVAGMTGRSILQIDLSVSQAHIHKYIHTNTHIHTYTHTHTKGHICRPISVCCKETADTKVYVPL